MERIMSETFGGAGYANTDTLHPIALAIVLICGLFLLVSSRRNAIWPILIVTCFIVSAQRIVIFTLDFSMLRIIILFGILRMFLTREHYHLEYHVLDKVLICFFVSKIIIHTIQAGSSGFVMESGYTFEYLGLYFLFRIFLQTQKDVQYVIQILLIISIPLSFFFLNEYNTGRNVFSIFGGVPEYSVIRNDRLRCQGAFSHPIIAGCFWASLIPMFIALWWDKNTSKVLIFIGVTTSLLIIFTTASSTPLMGVLSGLFGLLLFPLRYKMKPLRWLILLMLITLHLVMQAPIWHLISRISPVSGSTSYFRYKMIDSAINHFNEWWLVGSSHTAHWFYGAQDITNQYVLEGLRGGFLTLILFIVCISIAFKSIGKIWRRQPNNKSYVLLVWSLGVALFVHCVNFIGVSYFGQISVILYLLFAMIASLDTYTRNQNI